MKAIVGLGNPGNKYRFTRHNVGFLVIDEIATKKKVKFKKNKFLSCFGQFKEGKEYIYLIKPLTYMNLSGRAVFLLKKKLKIKLEDLLVVCDDVNLAAGSIRFRLGGTSGGHNGLSSVIEELHTTNFPRLKIGIGRPPKGESLEDYVLRPIDEKAASSLLPAISRAAYAALFWVNNNLSLAMNKFNIHHENDKSQRC
jgi:PTH1 family peptidyl-tRNA hydrolase